MQQPNDLLKHELIDAAKNWIAIDGLWFQATGQEYGMDASVEMDRRVWQQFSVIEAERIKKRLALPDRGGWTHLKHR